MTFGRTLFLLRKNAGFNQVEFAKKCNLSQTYLSQIENDKKEPHLSTLKSICNELDIPLPIFFFLTLESSDIPENKRNAFEIIFPSIKAFIQELFPMSNS